MLSTPNSLKMLYAIKRSIRLSSTKYRYYHYQVEAERLRLAELGECPQCIKNYCNYLVYGNIKVCEVCRAGQLRLDLNKQAKPLGRVRIHPSYNDTIAA